MVGFPVALAVQVREKAWKQLRIFLFSFCKAKGESCYKNKANKTEGIWESHPKVEIWQPLRRHAYTQHNIQTTLGKHVWKESLLLPGVRTAICADAQLHRWLTAGDEDADLPSDAPRLCCHCVTGLLAQAAQCGAGCPSERNSDPCQSVCVYLPVGSVRQETPGRLQSTEAFV